MALLGGSRLAAALLAFAAITLAARRLGPAELGLWGLALAVQGYALHLGELGLRSVATAEAGSRKGGARLILPVYLKTRFALSLGVYGLGLLACLWLRPDLLGLMALILASVVLIALMMDWVALVEDRPGQAGIMLLARPAVFLSLLLLLPGVATAEGLAGLFALSWAAAALLSWSCLRRTAPPPAAAPPRARELLALGWPLFTVTLLNQAQISLDLLLVGWTLGTAAAGQYYLASQITVAALVFANAMGQLAMARMARHRDDAVAFRVGLKAELRTLGMISLGLGAGLGGIAPWLVPRLFGAAYGDAAGLLVWFVPWLVLQGFTTLLQGAMTARRQQPDLLRANLVMVTAMAPLLLIAMASGHLEAFALTRALTEAIRLAILVKRLDHP